MSPGRVSSLRELTTRKLIAHEMNNMPSIELKSKSTTKVGNVPKRHQSVHPCRAEDGDVAMADAAEPPGEPKMPLIGLRNDLTAKLFLFTTVVFINRVCKRVFTKWYVHQIVVYFSWTINGPLVYCSTTCLRDAPKQDISALGEKACSLTIVPL